MPAIRPTRSCVQAAVTFLAIAALFQIFDGGQVIGAGALRGLKDTRWPMVFAALAYWVVGMAWRSALASALGLGGLGVWIGLAARARGRGGADDRPLLPAAGPASTAPAARLRWSSGGLA